MGRKLVFAVMLAMWMLVSLTTAIAQQAKGGNTRGRGQSLMRQMDRAARWWNRPQIADKVGLSDDQKARLDAVADEAEKKRAAASAEFAEAYARYLDALSEVTVDESVIGARRREIEATGASVMAVSVDQLIAVRKTLTPEQWTTLREVVPGALTLGQSRLRRVGAGPRSAGAETQPN